MATASAVVVLEVDLEFPAGLALIGLDVDVGRVAFPLRTSRAENAFVGPRPPLAPAEAPDDVSTTLRPGGIPRTWRWISW